MGADKPTRVAVDLIDSATVEGARQSRSAKQQLDHWIRVGRAVSSRESASRLRIEQALRGELSLSDLDRTERTVANAEIDATIQQRAQVTSFGAVAWARGITTVALDDDGNLVEHRPDGSESVIG